MRRDANDQKWQAVKKTVAERDQGADRLLKVLSYAEAISLKRRAGPMLRVLDPAHYVPVSYRPDLCYDENNIVLLNRYSHDCLDNHRDPVTGVHITKEQVTLWWGRILEKNEQQYESLKSRNLI